MSAANALSPEQPSKAVPDARAADPSMEDILASIRRIIADDQSRSLASASNAYRRAAAAQPMPPLPASHGQDRMDEADAQTPTPLDALEALPDDSAIDMEPAASSADFPETPRGQTFVTPLSWSAPQPHLNPPAVPSTTEADLSVIAEIVNAGAASILHPPAPAAEDQGEPLLDEPAPEPFDAGFAVLSLQGFEAVPDPEEAEYPPAEPVVEPLVSLAVGASVGSSFQTLATSVFLQNTGAVEALTRDMLRPMLKTWLDDNLPTIVERLVRVEIERVARGIRN